MEVMFSLRIFKELGHSMSEGLALLLLELADACWRENGYAETAKLFEGPVEGLPGRRNDPDYYMVSAGDR